MKRGDIRIGHYALAFGEPDKYIALTLHKPDGYFEAERRMTPDEAIEFAKELIRRAKLLKKTIKIWNKKRIPSHIVWADEALKQGYYHEWVGLK